MPEKLLSADGERMLSAVGHQRTPRSTPDKCDCCGESEDPVGAICYPDGTCAEGTEDEAGDTGGTYQGDGTTCEDEGICPGAICPDVGECYQGTLAEAEAAEDDYIGFDISCDDVDCECSACHFYDGQQMSIEAYLESARYDVNDDDCQDDPCLMTRHDVSGTVQFWKDGNPSAPGIFNEACTFAGQVTARRRFDNTCDGASQHTDVTEQLWFKAKNTTGSSWSLTFQSFSDGTLTGFPSFVGNHNCDGQPVMSFLLNTCTAYQMIGDGRCNPAYCEGEQDPGLPSGHTIATGGFTVG